MPETTSTLIGTAFAILLWLGWALFSETRHNHGFWVAFLLPLFLIVSPLIWLIYILINYLSLLVFVLIGRREQHAEFMRKLKVRSGIFLLF
jgi:di/tricarboxylate transporter